METKEFLKELRNIRVDNMVNNGENTSLYEFISNNWHDLEKEQLKELVLNFDYLLYTTFSREKFLELENKVLYDTNDRLKED